MKINVKRLINLMCRDGVNQSQLADGAGLTQATISRILNQKNNPDIESIGKIAKFFDVCPEELAEV